MTVNQPLRGGGKGSINGKRKAFAGFLALLLAAALFHAGFVQQTKAAPAMKPLRVSIPASDFALKDMKGKSVRLSDFRGKVVLLNFWATWCLPCRREMPSLERLYQSYRSRGLVVVAVSIDRASSAKVRAFAEEMDLSFPVLHDPDDLTSPRYGVIGIPYSFLISPAGRIVYRVAGEYAWDDRPAKAAVEYMLQGMSPSRAG